jgi:hypothetical protein
MILYHVSLRTGEVDVHRIDAMEPCQIEQAEDTLWGNGPVAGRPPFRVEGFSSMFSVFRGRELLVTCGLGEGQDTMWEVLTGLQELTTPVTRPTPPRTGRWLAVVEYPGLQNLAPGDREWLDEFECSLAAVLLKRRA